MFFAGSIREISPSLLSTHKHGAIDRERGRLRDRDRRLGRDDGQGAGRADAVTAGTTGLADGLTDETATAVGPQANTIAATRTSPRATMGSRAHGATSSRWTRLRSKFVSQTEPKPTAMWMIPGAVGYVASIWFVATLIR